MVRKSFTIDRYCAVYLPPSWIVINPFAAGILLRENSVMILETARFGVVRMYKILNGYSPNDAACRMIPHSWSAGRIKERRPLLLRCLDAASRMSLYERVSVCLAFRRLSSGALRELSKYGGLEKIRSNSISGSGSVIRSPYAAVEVNSKSDLCAE